MFNKLIDKVWHQKLGRPYQLAKAIDVGSGESDIVLLHGIGQSSVVWKHVVDALQGRHRIVAFDLLGFGASPKPEWKQYDADDHAQSVIASIKKTGLNKPIIIIGHSMGCLVAARIAVLRPDLVRHLVLYEMPLYEGLPNKRIYRLRTDLYLRFYKRVIEFKPNFDLESAKLVEKLAHKILAFDINETTWIPFRKSLENTIVKQTTAEDIKQIRVPMDVIYGSLDMLVIRGKANQFFGEEADNINSFTVRAGHVITNKAAKLIQERVEASLQLDTPSKTEPA